MKKFNKTLAIAFFAAISAFSFQSASATPTVEIDDSHDPILMESKESNESTFANYIGPEWSSVDKLIEDNPDRAYIVEIGYAMYLKRKEGTLCEYNINFYLLPLQSFGTPELVIYLLLTAS